MCVAHFFHPIWLRHVLTVCAVSSRPQKTNDSVTQTQNHRGDEMQMCAFSNAAGLPAVWETEGDVAVLIHKQTNRGIRMHVTHTTPPPPPAQYERRS